MMKKWIKRITFLNVIQFLIIIYIILLSLGVAGSDNDEIRGLQQMAGILALFYFWNKTDIEGLQKQIDRMQDREQTRR